MSDTRSRSGILIAVAAAVGAFGAAAMMSAATAPTARADDSTLIIDAIDGDFAAGQADSTIGLADLEGGSPILGLTDLLGGGNEYALAVPQSLILGTVEALEGDPITSTLFVDDVQAPGNFADALADAQIFFNEGEGFLSNSAIDFSAGDYGAGTYEGLVGSDYATVLPLEELLLGALASLDPGM
jgi:hypothetical protein